MWYYKFSSMGTITFQDFVLKLSLHTSIIKHNNSIYPHSNPSKKGIQKLHKKMEQNLPIIAKKFWNIFRVAYFVLRKNIPRPKLLSDLNMIMKRGKIVGKAAIHNLIFHHHHHHTPVDGDRQDSSDEYEFSCDNTPAHPTFRLPFHLNKRKRSPSPPPEESANDDIFAAAMEIAGAEEGVVESSVLPGLGVTQMVRQVRITDSPFPSTEIEEDGEVDEAVEKFIMKFYMNLKRQNAMAY
ncbi:hypothetical protein OROGR_005036 [Orobanche gracilis]